MSRGMLMARAERLRRRGGEDSDLIRALGRWLDRGYRLNCNGDWPGADTAFEYARAVYMELSDGSAD